MGSWVEVDGRERDSVIQVRAFGGLGKGWGREEEIPEI